LGIFGLGEDAYDGLGSGSADEDSPRAVELFVDPRDLGKKVV
jgi:hypothetical protein